MTNLLAILVSLAMMLTGATAPVAEPVSRTLQVSNLTVRHNEEEVKLSPYASVGVMTDGAKAVVDFFVGNGSNVYLPFQAVADEDGLLVLNDNSNVTLKIDKDQLEALLGEVDLEDEDLAVFELVGDYISAYGDLLKLMNDPDEMQDIQENAEAIYDELVDRGEGEEGSAEYDGEVFDVTTYEYDLTAKQMGALADAVYASNDKLAKFTEVYFRLLNALPEDSGLSGADSFEALMERFDNISLHVTESIAESGLNISDMLLHIAVPEMEEPLEFVIHTVKNDDEKVSEMTGDIDADGLAVSLYMEAEQTGRDMQMNMTVTGNPSGEAEETVYEADIDDLDDAVEIVVDEDEEYEDDEEEPDEEEPDDEDDDELVDGEGDAEDAFFFNLDFDRSYDEDIQTVYQSLAYVLEVAEEDIHTEFGIDGTMPEDGESDCLVSGEMKIGEESYGFEFNVSVSDEAIEARADAGNAVSLDEFDPSVLVASVSADALNLYTDESVQKLIAMAQSAMETATETAAGSEIIEDVAGAEAGAEAAPAEMTFGNPQFNWLPEGYKVENLNVDEEYQDVNCSIVNEETGDSIFIDIAASYADTNVNHYSLNGDGTYEPIDSVILNEEVGDGYSMYTLDDGTVSISIFPSGDSITTEDVAHLLAELTF